MPIKKVAAWALGLGALAAGAATMAQEREDRGGGGGGGRGGGGGLATVRIPQHMTAELNMLIGQKKTALEIRDFLSGEFEPLPLGDLMVYFRAQEKAGTIRLTPRPPDPALAKKGLTARGSRLTPERSTIPESECRASARPKPPDQSRAPRRE